MAPLSAGAAMLPAAALRADPAVALTTALRYGPGLMKAGLVAGQLTGPFSGACLHIVRCVDLKPPRALLGKRCMCSLAGALRTGAVHRPHPLPHP